MVLRVACVGAGYFSQFHIGSWKRMPGAMLVGACDLDIERARSAGVPAYSDFSAMLDEVKPDIVDIILPPVAHVNAIRTVLISGIRTFLRISRKG